MVIGSRIPPKITRGLVMSEKQTTLSDFLDEVAKENEKNAVPETNLVDRETLRAAFDTIYENYIVEGYTAGIEGEYGTSTAVRMTSPDGEKVTMWVSSYEADHFESKVKGWENEGHSLPVKISFARTKAESAKSGRTYNKLNIQTVATGDEVQFELDAL